MDNRIVMIRGSFNATDALCVVASLTGEADAQVEKDVIFPYYCFDASCMAPAAAGRKDVSVICLVDAVNGLGATADSFELKKEPVKASRLMDLTIDDEHARRIAERTVTHRLSKSFRAIADFDVRLTSVQQIASAPSECLYRSISRRHRGHDPSKKTTILSGVCIVLVHQSQSALLTLLIVN